MSTAITIWFILCGVIGSVCGLGLMAWFLMQLIVAMEDYIARFLNVQADLVRFARFRKSFLAWMEQKKGAAS